MQNNLFGYQEIEESLLSNFQNNKLHHALLFCGNSGIGKASFARQLADKLLDVKNPNNANPDLLLIKRELNQKQELKRDITVDSIRKINDFLNLTSAFSKYRVIIIDSIDDMNRNSVNALLKILEEPPADVFLFLISSNPGKLPITIKSRCNIIKVNPLNIDDFTKALNQIESKIEDAEAKALFNLSSGSLSAAVDFYENDGLKLYDEIVSSIKQKGSDISGITKKIADKKFPWEIFEKMINIYLNKSAKIASTIKFTDYISANEEESLHHYGSRNKLGKIFDINEKISELLSKTKSLNLDKKQTINNIFNIIS